MAIQRSLLVLIPSLFTGIAGCLSAPSLRVDADVLDKITIENKLRLFDAENELNIAIDARDQVVDEIVQIKENVRRAARKREVAERDISVFERQNDRARLELAELRRDTADAHLDYLDARLEWARERLDRERRALIVAKARFELAKARLVKRNNVPGASDIDLADFEAQVERYQDDVGETAEQIEEAEVEMKAREQNWIAQSKALRQATGGALGSRWLD